MIPFEELDKALARWKSRSQGGVSVDAALKGAATTLEAAMR